MRSVSVRRPHVRQAHKLLPTARAIASLFAVGIRLLACTDRPGRVADEIRLPVIPSSSKPRKSSISPDRPAPQVLVVSSRIRQLGSKWVASAILLLLNLKSLIVLNPDACDIARRA
jgi:hypothetical protein